MVLICTLKFKTTWWYSQVSEANGFTPVEGNPLRSYVACIMHGKWNLNPPTVELPSPNSPFYDNQS